MGLTIIESIQSQAFIFRLEAETNPRPGLVVDLSPEPGFVKVSNGLRPFGLLEKVEDGMAHIWHDTMVLRTNVYDRSCHYELGDFIYVNKHGQLSVSRENHNYYLVGRVISKKNSFLEISWI